VPEQKLDLLQIAATFPAQLGAGRGRRSVLYRFALMTMQLLRDRAQQTAVFDAGYSHPGVDAVLDPDGDGDGAHAPALALEVGQNPPAFALLDGRNVELGQLVPPEGAADQQRQDHVIAFSFQGRAVGDGDQFFRLLAGQPVPSRVPFWLMLGMSVRLAASSDPIMLFRVASPARLRTAESRTLIVEGESGSMPARHSINKDRERGGWHRRRTDRPAPWRSSAGYGATGPRPAPTCGAKPGPG
jgi:hypothetical protein